MVPPKQLDPTEQDALVKQIGLAMLRSAPEDWDRVTIDYRAVGRYAETDGEIVYSDDEIGDWPVPQEIAAMFARLRAGMYRDGRGTWFNATYRLDHPSSYNLDYDRDEPEWRQPPPPQAYADDLATFPRTGDNIPEWLMRRVSNASPELPGPRFRVARIFDGQAGNGRPLVNRPTIPEGDRAELLGYLNSAPVVSASRPLEIDRLDPEGRPLVPVAFHTDGTWIWPAAVNYYLHNYGISPEHELLDHIRRQGARLPVVDEAARTAAAGFLSRGGPPLRRPHPDASPRQPGSGPPFPLADRPPRAPFPAGRPLTDASPRPLTDASPRLPGDQRFPRGDGPPLPAADGPPGGRSTRPPGDGPPFPLADGPPLPLGDGPPFLPGDGPPPLSDGSLQHPGGHPPRLPSDQSTRPPGDGPPSPLDEGSPHPFGNGSPRLPDAPRRVPGDRSSQPPSDGPPFPYGDAQPPGDGPSFPFGDAASQPPGEGSPFPFGDASPPPPGDGSPRLPGDRSARPPGDDGSPRTPGGGLRLPGDPPFALTDGSPRLPGDGSTRMLGDGSPLPPGDGPPRPMVEGSPRQRGGPPGPRVPDAGLPAAALPSQGPPSATLDALRSRLGALGVPQSAYQLGSPAERTWTMDQTPEGWRVGWYEREFVAPAMFEDVADAAAFLIGKLMLDAGRPATPEPQPILVNVPATVADPAEPADPETVRADPVPVRAPEPQPTMVAAGRVTEREARRSAQPAARWPIQPMSGEPPLTLFRGKRMIELAPGTEIDRFGDPDGNLTYAAGTPFTDRSLVPDWIERPYHTYRVERPTQALSGTAIPWFEQAGGGTAYVLPEAVEELIADGTLIELPGRKPPTE